MINLSPFASLFIHVFIFFEKLYRNTLTVRQAATIEIFKRLVTRLIRLIYSLRYMINLSPFASLFIHVFLFFNYYF